MKKNTTVTDFLENEYSGSALYMNYRATPSYIDGLKNSGRKVIYVAKKKHLSGEAKVSQFASVVAAESGYIHGDTSLQGTIVTLAQDYKGANNLPIIKGVGSFGTAFMNEASAARYIFIKPQPYFEELFKEADDSCLIKQEFEGDEVEPRYYVPTLPMLLVNGCTGIGVGFSSKVLGRPPKNIIEIIRHRLNKEAITEDLFTPNWPSFKGTVERVDKCKWNISGVCSLNKKKLTINELPIGYELQQYLSILKKLKEKGIITKIEDFSENDNYKFVATLDDTEAKKSISEIMVDLKLTITVTETLTCIDENNAIIEFDSPESLFDKYFDFKIESLKKRIANELIRLESEAKELKEIQDFINLIIDGTVNLKQKRAVLEEQLAKLGFINMQKLLSMPIYSITEEKAFEAKAKYEAKLKEMEAMKEETPKSIWLKDIKALEKKID